MSNKLPRIISFSGRKHSGKTELANVCINYGYTLINFADSLKDMVCHLLEMTREYLDNHKETICVYDLSNKIQYVSNEIDIKEEIVGMVLSKPFCSIRMILQIIGTDLIRKHNPQWHLQKIREKLVNNSKKYYCIGDCRFKNEKSMLEELGAECWFIIRPNMFDISNHQSEIDLLWNQFTNVIINNTCKEIFVQKWENYLSTMIQINREKYYYNVNTFLEATKESSYVMGLLCIKQDKLTCALHTDKYIVEMFQKVLKSNRPICLHEVCHNPFIIENSKLWNMNKEIPFLLRNNLGMLKYWIVGLIDGNGCISLSKNELHLLIVASNTIIDYLHTILPYGEKSPHDNVYELHFYNHFCVDFYKWLGEAVTIGLKERWNKINMYILSKDN
jgi:hypothetical protein